ncbi:aminotransferase class V-fold PLP-dependent enzyme [Staphylococcus aureus]|nr:aminotransferase class V-fold PLP-dependent enzyme [Staphylococcus aureus]MBJ6281140.1 aminotransferase class V-fold PLP-dependent enzyme [Staphylococcus aureus]MBJ6283897.1 aminotransferase class V-fold PLP-dependent enzyme [Staphylococcus aureus]MBJ6286618.1 aminotransferase class V-fold PLP-dependent enzyme [Staphylococcus aureus]MBJ6303305.1 aminotransferase class V-fold PLP-dependent enzyme [Staphylococcus aureus]
MKNNLYFNTGELSIVIKELKCKMIRGIKNEFYYGRSRKGSRKKFNVQLSHLREQIADLIGAYSEEITITDNTTFGLNIVLNGMKFNTGDEIITTSMEHLASISPLMNLKKQKSVIIKEYKVTKRFNIKKLEELITCKTKMIVISHIFWKTGEVIPIKEVIDIAHSKGVKVLVDGAQAVGSYPVNLHNINADFYCFPAHKWLYGPEGLGFLFVRKNIQKDLDIIFSGISTFQHFNDYNDYSIQDNGQRWELGTMFRPSVYGMNDVLKYLTDTIKLENIYVKTQNLNNYMKCLVSDIANISIVTDNNYNICTLIFPENINCKALKEHLEYFSIFTKDIVDINAIRISLSFINNEDDIQFLLKKIKEYMEE